MANYEFNRILEQKLNAHLIDRTKLYKDEVRIGMLPETMIVEYFTSFYLKKLTVGTKMKSFRLESIQDSTLREKCAIITLQKPYYYLQALTELYNKAINYDGRFCVFSSPKDKNLAAGFPYRNYIDENFELVVVENGCYLEPSYVVITSIPEASDPPINIAKIKEEYGLDGHV